MARTGKIYPISPGTTDGNSLPMTRGALAPQDANIKRGVRITDTNGVGTMVTTATFDGFALADPLEGKGTDHPQYANLPNETVRISYFPLLGGNVQTWYGTLKGVHAASDIGALAGITKDATTGLEQFDVAAVTKNFRIVRRIDTVAGPYAVGDTNVLVEAIALPAAADVT